MTNKKAPISTQTKRSIIVGEIFNAITHGIGAGLAIVALVLLLIKAIEVQNPTKIIAYSIYGSSLILLFLASTLYHSFKLTKAAKIFQRIDHTSIYLLIAGTYTPFCLIGIGGSFGLTICIGIWLFAIGGMFIELFFLEKFSKVSVFLYLALGWMAIFTIRPLFESMGWGGILYLIAGGASYSLGTIFYKRKYHNFYHVIWHLFVLAGAIFMFLAVFKYL